MTKKTIPLNFSWLLFFLTTIYTFLVGQLYYLTTKGPDYDFYEPYFNYFFGKLPSTGVEQGLLYYFLNASIISVNSQSFIPDLWNQHFSNSIQAGNFFLYLIGIYGIYTFLKNKNINKVHIIITLSLINIFPPAVEMRLLFKPEILIFSCLIWTIIFLDRYLESESFLNLLFSIPPLSIILTTKANLAVMVALFLTTFYLYKIYKVNKTNFFMGFLILTTFFLLISYENYQANGLFIHQHQSPEEFTSSAKLSFLYNVNIDTLINNPFRQSQKDSYLGIMFLDTFDDYFGNFWNDDSSPLYLNRSVFVSTKATVYLGLMFTVLFYYYLVKNIFNNRKNRYLYTMPFFGILVQMILSQFTQFNPDTGDVAKTYYYSFFLVITFALLSTEFAKQKIKVFIVFCLVFSISIVHIYGFPKNQSVGETDFINMNNEINSLCILGDMLLTNVASGCAKKEYIVCDYTFNKRELVSISNSQYQYKDNIPAGQLNLNKNETEILVHDFDECINKIDNGYRHVKNFNIENIPFMNVFNLFLLLFSIFLYGRKNVNSEKSNYIY